MKRAVLYLRISSAEHQDPAGQLLELRRWCEVRGWRVVGEELDKVSGDPARRKGDPPGLRRAFEALERRRADVLVVWAADRLVRSPIDLLRMVARVQSLGAAVASYQDGADLDTTTEMGELLTFMRGWWARMELKTIRARTRMGLEAARARGEILGRRRVVVPAAAIARARELRAAGLGAFSRTTIARALGAVGVTARPRPLHTGHCGGVNAADVVLITV